jgi:hypothetical protein
MRRSSFVARLGRLLAARLGLLLLALLLVSVVSFGLISTIGSSPSSALRGDPKIPKSRLTELNSLPPGPDNPSLDRALTAPTSMALAYPTSTTAAAESDDAYKYSAPTTGGAAGSTGVPADAFSQSIHSGTTGATTYQSPLTAGQVNDNDQFNEYLDYLRNYQGPPVHSVPVADRMFLRVLDADQHPVAGALVQLFDGNQAVFAGRTVSDGRVLFLPQAEGISHAQEFRAVISRGQQQVAGTVKAGAAETAFSLTGLKDNSGPVGLDIVFLLDATGSMGDEIDHIKATIDSIASRITQLPGSSAPRLGLVAFRDRGDEYVTRSWDFTADVQQFAANLANVQAGGGGDTPESVNAGLHDAIHLPGWTTPDSGRHLRMIFLVGDAPPHLDYPNDYEYTALLNDAVEAGIKIFPIGASGLEQQGEFIFRQFAQITQGQFVFLTYANGVSGAPGVATDKHVSNFTVNQLDSLVVNLVAGEIAAQTGQPAAQASNLVPVVNNVLVAPPVATSPLMTMAQQLSRFAEESNLGLWLVGVLAVVWWVRQARQAPGRARRGIATDSVALPPISAPVHARVELTPADAPVRPAAFVAPAAYPAEVVIVEPASAGRRTAPLPALPPDVTARIG